MLTSSGPLKLQPSTLQQNFSEARNGTSFKPTSELVRPRESCLPQRGPLGGGSSLLQRCSHRLQFGAFTIFRSSLLRSLRHCQPLEGRNGVVSQFSQPLAQSLAQPAARPGAPLAHAQRMTQLNSRLSGDLSNRLNKIFFTIS